MRRYSILALTALALVLAVGALPAHAQDILGVSFRATDEMPPGTERGTADIRQGDDGYLVSADFSNVASSLVLDDFDGAKSWVVWAVAMDAAETNVGSLDANLVLEDAKIDFMPAGLLMSAEASADADKRSGEPLFRVTLRQTTQSTAAATAATSPTVAAAAPTATATTAAAAASSATAAKPKDLPTTGGALQDLIVLALVAAGLFAGGLQIRRVRV
jgi:hypothetical protein